eukprot:TRINITY_DN4160_c0_g1_i2.p1 TRINITY_DN4160_c0_g1~~TRINITY_DN4160_c0_g1_i2.p1  ORF type:complete len:470 (+),score=65.04 TRINITY_DN4160_c0_g1_i2:71-1480(+)
MRCPLLVGSDGLAQGFFGARRALSTGAFFAIVVSVTGANAATGDDANAKGSASSATDAEDDSPIWHYLSSRDVGCPHGPQEAKAQFTISEFASEELPMPFIVTFYRSSLEEVTFKLQVQDAAGTFVLPGTRVKLIDASSLATSSGKERRLRAASAFTGGRRRRSASGSGSMSASGMAGTGLAGFGAAEGKPMRFMNPYQPLLSYGYMSAAARLAAEFRAGYQKTDYGITGTTRPERGETVRIALPSFAGDGGSRKTLEELGRWKNDEGGNLGKTCVSGTWHGPCSDCVSRTLCFALLDLPQVLVRDDLTTTGFTPGDYKFPLVLTISKIHNADFSAKEICDLNGMTNSSAPSQQKTSSPRIHHNLFVALTEVDVVAALLPSNEDHMMFLYSILAGVALCSVGFFLCVLYKVVRASELTDEAEEDFPQAELARSNTAERAPLLCSRSCSATTEGDDVQEMVVEMPENRPP